MNSQKAQQYLKEYLMTIYQVWDTYHLTNEMETKYQEPALPSFEQSSDNIARKIASKATHSKDGDNKANTLDNTTYQRRKKGTIIDYEDFLDLQKDTEKQTTTNYWETKEKL